MSNIVARSAGWGAIFGAIAAFASGLCLAIFWSTERTGHTGDFAMLMALWVPPVAIVGGGAAAVLFGVVAVIASFSLGRIETSPLSYAVLGSLLSLGLVILPFATWVAGGLFRALPGAQGMRHRDQPPAIEVEVKSLESPQALATPAVRGNGRCDFRH